MQRSLMDTRGAVTQEAPKETPKPDLAPVVDRLAELRAQATELTRRIERASLPFDDDIRTLQDERDRAIAKLLDDRQRAIGSLATKKQDAETMAAQLERQILEATAGQELAFVAGTNGARVQVKRSFMRKVDADGLWDALNREGKLGHYGYLFRKSVTVKDFEGAARQPLFVKDAESFVERSVKSETVEVV